MIINLGGLEMGIVFSNLRVVMAMRNVSIKDINENTTLSRTTISNLVNNNATGIQYDTLAQLCEYLNCSVGDILTYSLIEVLSISLEDTDKEIPTQQDEKFEWYKEKDFHLSAILFNGEVNLQTGALLKVQEGYHDKERKNIIHGIFFDSKLHNRISQFFSSSIIADEFIEEITIQVVMELKKYGFSTGDSVVTISTFDI